jgi:PIF1-like helicase
VIRHSCSLLVNTSGEPQTFGKFQVAVLRECKRQSDLEFIALLNRMRIGEMTWHDFNGTLRSRLLLPGQLQDLDMTNGAILYPRKAGKDDYNQSILNSMEGRLWEYVAHDTDATGAPIVNVSTMEFFESMYRMGKLPPKTLSLKVGAKVMLLRNLHVQHGWVNGAICIVDECTPDSVSVHLCDFPKRTKTLCREKNKCPYSVGPPSLRNQIPLDLGWASTVHKGQGRTLHPTVYDANGQFASGGGYTACSRAPALSELHLIRLGEMSEYFVEPSIKKLLEWLDDHDVCRGWDDRRKRSPMPRVPHQNNLKRLKVVKVKKQLKCDVVPAPVLPIDEDFIENSGEFQLPPIPPSVDRDDADVQQILQDIQNIPVDTFSVEEYSTLLRGV